VSQADLTALLMWLELTQRRNQPEAPDLAPTVQAR